MGCYDLVHLVRVAANVPGRIDDQTLLERHTESPRFSGPAQCCSEFRGGCIFTSHDGNLINRDKSSNMEKIIRDR